MNKASLLLLLVATTSHIMPNPLTQRFSTAAARQMLQTAPTRIKAAMTRKNAARTYVGVSCLCGTLNAIGNHSEISHPAAFATGALVPTAMIGIALQAPLNKCCELIRK